jgi:hypothetical protein
VSRASAFSSDSKLGFKLKVRAPRQSRRGARLRIGAKRKIGGLRRFSEIKHQLLRSNYKEYCALAPIAIA